MNLYPTIRQAIIYAVYIFIITACSSSIKDNVPERNFYFEVIAKDSDPSIDQLAFYLQEQIPKKKYTITNSSGMVWPFYKELGLKEAISIDSLMPPHWFIHKMIPLKKHQQIKRDEFLVRIELLSRNGTMPGYKVDVFKMDSLGLTLSATSGVHTIDSTEFILIPMQEVYLRSIIRYSFK